MQLAGAIMYGYLSGLLARSEGSDMFAEAHHLH